MKTRNHRQIFTTMLLANLATTAITCSLIYGMLTGMLPSPANLRRAEAAVVPGPAVPVDGVRGRGAQPADFHASAGAAAGDIVLLCRQARDDVSSGRSGVDVRPGEGRLKPLVDRPDRHLPGQGGDQFSF